MPEEKKLTELDLRIEFNENGNGKQLISDYFKGRIKPNSYTSFLEQKLLKLLNSQK